MANVSPPKWHLEHVSWFFKTFILLPFYSNYKVFNSQFNYLFNSYYQGIGAQFPKAQRGLFSRPSVAEVYSYRKHVDHFIGELITALQQHQDGHRIQQLIVLGLNHEPVAAAALQWQNISGGEMTIGYGGNDFHFDNEQILNFKGFIAISCTNNACNCPCYKK